ncbi:hypothetical protein GQ44DRAFT_797204 [Phaeosphaeriaceae sp. PMI808]|nr:hypothetical protein GQ44DRAFT_797204 [Phaeosphaeriaceae sp. PMI808]
MVLTILDVAAGMEHYCIPDPYNKGNKHYINYYVCLWEVPEEGIVGHYKWGDQAKNYELSTQACTWLIIKVVECFEESDRSSEHDYLDDDNGTDSDGELKRRTKMKISLI